MDQRLEGIPKSNPLRDVSSKRRQLDFGQLHARNSRFRLSRCRLRGCFLLPLCQQLRLQLTVQVLELPYRLSVLLYIWCFLLSSSINPENISEDVDLAPHDVELRQRIIQHVQPHVDLSFVFAILESINELPRHLQRTTKLPLLHLVLPQRSHRDALLGPQLTPENPTRATSRRQMTENKTNPLSQGPQNRQSQGEFHHTQEPKLNKNRINFSSNQFNCGSPQLKQYNQF
uniref:(northern house mosquito) hypothetical protein n=1 Tax=Culex pipiens TaxID=7175 RepID=A0A8D8E734_CULPI